MDLLDIRKKAKARKEAEEAARVKAASGGGQAREDTPAGEDKAAGGGTGEVAPPVVPGPPPVEEAQAIPEEAEPVEPAAVEAEYLAFMLSEEEYALKIEDVREIIRPRKITAVPRAPGFVMGVISLRGMILPVFDIKKRLGLGEAELSRPSRILVVSDRGSEQGIMVDRVTGVVRLGPDDIGPPPSVIGGVEAGYLEGVGRLGDRLLILFDTQKVLSMD